MEYRYLRARGALNDAELRSSDAPSVRHGHVHEPSIPRKLIELFPESLARETLAIPVKLRGETLVVATVDPLDIALADKLTFVLAKKIQLIPYPRERILALIERYYGSRGESESVDSMLQEFCDTAIAEVGSTGGAAASRSPVPVSKWEQPRPAPAAAGPTGLDPTRSVGDPGVFTYVIEEGQRVLMRRPNGTMDVIVGPKRVWRGKNIFRPMQHFVAHPGDYLIVRFRDGRQEHQPGPAEVWFDPRIHQEVTRQEALQVAAKEAVVVYSSKEGTSTVQRRIENGPTLFTPRPGEWLHTFAWHSSDGGSQGARKVPGGLVFQKLWLMPDQMYHDVTDVRTADDAVLTIRLMIFFELLDITTMLETTHDPIGDFVNAATSDVVDFTSRHDFESFKRNTDKLNELATYRQLTGRATQCGYRLNKVVYRGYGAPERLQLMHDQAIEARTRLQLERATEQQAQDLENFKLDSQMHRAGKRRHEQTSEVEHDLELARKKQEASLTDREARMSFERQQGQLDADLRQQLHAQRDAQQREHLASLRDMGVDLTAFLTQNRADRVIELRGPKGATHVHLDPNRGSNGLPEESS
ncbi:Type II secretion system (T2SS), protein E, N-terminal domain [Singulisphaera sp. GP187]|uniref:GspE/PulE/PilB domain-containing protein n=1 Tax=Singulisphaera sp. GP187 TaxID=1882752 RepID=UPI00092899E3|nr:hypothetical protein [Singulisphaera sp. GP187]SIO12378.1 Type II secretion system (T2SS), protein E, N-terminal domain [Singulisphaera sp. GP187]